MEIKQAEVKASVLKLLNYTEEVDKNKRPIPRAGFHKDHYRAILGLNKRLGEDVEIALIDNEKVIKSEDGTQEYCNPADLEWVWVKAVDQGEKRRKFSERFRDGAIDLTTEEVRAIKYYHQQMTDIPRMTEAALEEFERIVK